MSLERPIERPGIRPEWQDKKKYKKWVVADMVENFEWIPGHVKDVERYIATGSNKDVVRHMERRLGPGQLELRTWEPIGLHYLGWYARYLNYEVEKKCMAGEPFDVHLANAAFASAYTAGMIRAYGRGR